MENAGEDVVITKFGHARPMEELVNMTLTIAHPGRSLVMVNVGKVALLEAIQTANRMVLVVIQNNPAMAFGAIIYAINHVLPETFRLAGRTAFSVYHH